MLNNYVSAKVQIVSAGFREAAHGCASSLPRSLVLKKVKLVDKFYFFVGGTLVHTNFDESNKNWELLLEGHCLYPTMTPAPGRWSQVY